MGTKGYRDGHKEYMKEYFRRNPKKYMLGSARKRATTFNLDFNITEDDFEIPKYCPILGIKLSQVRSSHKDKNAAPSLDRIDTTKGYVKGNIAVISFQANRYKSNMTNEVIERLYQYSLSSNA